MKSKMIFIDVITLLASLVLANSMIMAAFAEKNARAACINQQNQGFIGKEQSGDAYKFSKDTCQSLS